MKIAILTPTFKYDSGIDRVVQQQAESYAKKGDEVVVIALKANIKPKGYKVITLGMPKNIFLQRIYRLLFFLDFKKINYYKKLKNYDKIISHFYPMNWLAYKAKKHYNIDYIYWNHSINIEFKKSLLHNIYMQFLIPFNNITIKNVDKAFSVSKWAKKELKEQSGIDSKVQYIKVDKKRFNKNIKGDSIIKKYNLENKKVFLYVGRIAPHKRIEVIIKSFIDRKEHGPESKLIIVGGNSGFNRYYKKLRRMADKDVIFTGFVPDEELPYYYAACDVYVTASSWECFNIPVAEAQACGKPVIAFDIGAHPEVVDKKKGSVLVPEGKREEFANSMFKFAKSV
ncbi:glycosyltransferase family 4 protein [Candidatus Woesearchaeota archaeon]|nr:glycosyltransferase family 4 protein [Candidatus Woesearchaeota archaeon]